MRVVNKGQANRTRGLTYNTHTGNVAEGYERLETALLDPRQLVSPGVSQALLANVLNCGLPHLPPPPTTGPENASEHILVVFPKLEGPNSQPNICLQSWRQKKSSEEGERQFENASDDPLLPLPHHPLSLLARGPDFQMHSLDGVPHFMPRAHEGESAISWAPVPCE